jgi:MoaA/NifB/PqqE/SkfB family radical SAM enzyme
MASNKGLPLAIANSVTRDNLEYISEMADLSYELGASSVIFGQIMPSGRAALNKNVLLTDDEASLMRKKVNKVMNKYASRMTIQIGSTDIYQLNKSKVSPNSGAIIRPNGDVRLDCVVPVIAGNILTNDFCEIWNNKFKNVWSNETVIKYIDEVNNSSDHLASIINHVDQDISL